MWLSAFWSGYSENKQETSQWYYKGEIEEQEKTAQVDEDQNVKWRKTKQKHEKTEKEREKKTRRLIKG